MQTSAVGGLTLGFEGDSMPPSFVGQYLQAPGTSESPVISEVFTSFSTFLARDRWYVPPPSPRQEPMALVSDSGWCTPNEGGLRAGLDVRQDWWTAPSYGLLVLAACAVVYYTTTNTRHVPQILRQIETNAPHGNALAVRLRYLMSVTDEETAQNPELAPLSVPSLTDFAKFLAAEPRITKPSLTLTWDGHVRAEWRKDADHRAAAEFMGDGTAKLVIFAPEPSDPTRITRFSRQVEVPALARTIEPYDIPFLAETT